jgi:Tfp pilus assembly protein PilN
MITINLLPEAHRKPKISSVQQFHRSPLAILIVGAMVGVGLLLWATVLIHQARLAQLNDRIRRLEPKQAAAQELLASVQQLRDQQALFRRLAHERSQWARHLNRLSDAIPEGVWLTDLSLDPVKGLTIQGSAIAGGGEEMVRIGRLVQELKTDEAFSSAITDIQIESIKSVEEKELELIRFTLTGGLGASPSTP